MEWQTDRRHYHANSRTHWSAKRKQKMKQPLQSDVTAYTKVHLQQIMWTVSRRVGHKTVIVLQCRSLYVVRNICIWGWLSPSICQIFRKSGRPITTLYGFTHQTWRYKSSSNRFPVTKKCTRIQHKTTLCRLQRKDYDGLGDERTVEGPQAAEKTKPDNIIPVDVTNQHTVDISIKERCI